MTATNSVSGDRGPEAATAIRRQWLAMCADAAHMRADRVVDPALGHLQGILDEESGGRGADAVSVAAHVYGAQETARGLAAFATAEDLKSLKIVLEPSS